jgi:hypothetical protein
MFGRIRGHFFHSSFCSSDSRVFPIRLGDALMNIPSDASGRSVPAFWGKENSLAEARERDFG